MRIEFHWKGLDPSLELRDYARHRTHFRLGRLAHAIRRVVIRFEDTNGPRGGVDARCAVTVTGTTGHQVGEASELTFTAAADRALASVARGLARALDVARPARAARRGAAIRPGIASTQS